MELAYYDNPGSDVKAGAYFNFRAILRQWPASFHMAFHRQQRIDDGKLDDIDPKDPIGWLLGHCRYLLSVGVCLHYESKNTVALSIEDIPMSPADDDFEAEAYIASFYRKFIESKDDTGSLDAFQLSSMFHMFGYPSIDGDVADVPPFRPDIFTIPLFVGDGRIEKMDSFFKNVHRHVKKAPEFEFWQRWFQGFVDGQPLDWELQRRIATELPDEVWQAGPEAVAREITKIEALHELNKRIEKLENAAAVSPNRLGMGGNLPPEAIDEKLPSETKEVLERIVVVWDAVDTLSQEAGKDAPDPERFKAAMSAIGTALKAISSWAASKADLSVDTLIKWGIPSGCGYFVLDPDKLQAVFNAAKAFATVWF